MNCSFDKKMEDSAAALSSIILGNDIAVDPNLESCTLNDAEGVYSTLGATLISLHNFIYAIRNLICSQ